MSDFDYLHNKTLALNKNNFLMGYVATTSKLDISGQVSIFCMFSEEGSNGWLLTFSQHKHTNRTVWGQANVYYISR